MKGILLVPLPFVDIDGIVEIVTTEIVAKKSLRSEQACRIGVVCRGFFCILAGLQ